MHVVENNLNSEEYIDKVLKGRVVDQLNEFFPAHNGVFQQDNAPCHCSKRSRDVMENLNINVMNWPPQSPDLNPIENLWAIVKCKLKKYKMSKKSEIIFNFMQIWNHDEDIREICKKLVESMPRRVQAVLDAKGSHTKY